MTAIVYDAAVLFAADRSDRATWAEHRVRLEFGVVPLVPAGVVAQVSRTPRQAQLRRLLRGCRVVTLDEAAAHAVGDLLGRAGTTDVVDASVVVVGAAHDADIATGDPRDIERLLAVSGAKLDVIRV